MLQIIEVVEADVEILAEIQLEVLQVEVVAVVGETHARGDVVAEEVTHVGTDTEVVAFSRHPRTFRDEDGLLHFSVDTIHGSLATLGPSLPYAKGAEEGQTD